MNVQNKSQMIHGHTDDVVLVPPCTVGRPRVRPKEDLSSQVPAGEPGRKRRVPLALQGPERDDPLTAVGNHHGSDPKVRQLLKVQIDGTINADKAFTMLSDDEVEPRRELIASTTLRAANIDV